MEEKHLKLKKFLGSIILLFSILWALNTIGLIISMLIGYKTPWEHFNTPIFTHGEEHSPISFVGWLTLFWGAVICAVLLRLIGGKLTNISFNGGYKVKEYEYSIDNESISKREDQIKEIKKETLHKPEKITITNDRIKSDTEDKIPNSVFFTNLQNQKGIISTNIPINSNDILDNKKLKYGFTAIDHDMADNMNLNIGDELPLKITDKPVIDIDGNEIKNLYWAE